MEKTPPKAVKQLSIGHRIITPIFQPYIIPIAERSGAKFKFRVFLFISLFPFFYYSAGD
jgi:hypothetical protein